MLRRTAVSLTRRQFSTSAAATPAAESTFRAAPLPPPKKPVGAVRGGILGLLVGIASAGTIGYLYLVEEYQIASQSLLANVEQLGGSVNAVRASLLKADKLDAEVKAVKASAVRRDDVDAVKKELYKVIDDLTTDQLELKTRLWALEQELKKRA
ncbi:hypothetical protein BC828DRAFT_391576 [Blastocladiella britannica]|nr:hypothetical protein BC828DRAFT_391576 [Blastocladiella britannica]